MKTKKLHLIASVVFCLTCPAMLIAQQTLRDASKFAISSDNDTRGSTVTSRDITIEKIDNDYADFSVLVEVDKADYAEEDTLTARIKSSRDGYVYMIHISSTGKETMLIPNKYQADNAIKALQAVEYPTKGIADFVFRIGGPNFGRETIKVIVANRKLDSIDLQKYTQGTSKSIESKDSESLLSEIAKSKDIVVEGINEIVQSSEPITTYVPGNELQFATHQVSFTTHPKSQRQTQGPPKAKRFVVCFGPNKYLDPKINNLRVCANDARKFADLMIMSGGVREEDCVILLDEEVTRENVKKLFCEVLPKIVPVGSEIIVYWSGHGGRMSSTRNDTTTKGFAAYLVPYDGKTSDPENTMIMEGPFGHWVQNLNGRKLLFILDACYSGNMTERAKSIDASDGSETKGEKSLSDVVGDMINGSKSASGSGSKSTEDDSEGHLNFMFGFKSFDQSKALGQKGLAVLASSANSQLSWERNEGDLSVMTYYLINAVNEGPRSMTHKDLQPAIRKAVDEYVQKYHPNTRQTVVQQDDLTPGMRMKP